MAVNVFADILHEDMGTQTGSEAHFRLHFFRVIAQILQRVMTLDAQQVDALWATFPFLTRYQTVINQIEPQALPANGREDWWRQQIESWESNAFEHLPLRSLIDATALPYEALSLLIAAGLLEEDLRFGGLFAALQEPLPSRRPCMGLLEWLLGGADTINIRLLCHLLHEHGLLIIDNQQDPQPEWIIRVPPVIWDAIRAQVRVRPVAGLERQFTDEFPELDDLIVAPDIHDQLSRLPDVVMHGHVRTVLLRGMTGSGRRTIGGFIARCLQHDVLMCDLAKITDESRRLIAPLATLLRALPLIRCNPAPGETIELPDLDGYHGPVIVTLGRSGGLSGALLKKTISINLDTNSQYERKRFWERTAIPLAKQDADEIPQRFLLTGGYIDRAADLGMSYALLDGRDTITTGDVQQAMRTFNREALDTLATRLEPVPGWSALIVNDMVRSELHALEVRCQSRESLREHAGPAFAHSLNRGVRVMFSGPSGTGKTLGARVLAAEMQMDLYRVDLAAVVNKYIGETERNLNEIFSRAEELDVILLLDEGDSLMTRRTDVQSSNDRYANLETNYLLQRLESYEGIVVVTTNAASRIDSAFLRRLDVVIEFALPDADERRLLWQIHLPQSHQITDVFLDIIANRCQITGGQIRNAALFATLLAMEDGTPVSDAHLEYALKREYRKSGAAYPLRDASPVPNQIDRLRQLAKSLDHPD